MTATLGTLKGSVRFFADINGAMWVGWTDIDTANHVTYAGYLTPKTKFFLLEEMLFLPC